jgi:hypothetical protein
MKRSHLLIVLACVVGMNIGFWLATEGPSLTAREGPTPDPVTEVRPVAAPVTDAAPATSDPAAEARQVFDHGNALLRQARQAPGGADPALLRQAAAHYRGCLTYEPLTTGLTTLFEDARYNLELTKLLLAQGEQNKPAPAPEPGDALAKADKPSAKDEHGHDHDHTSDIAKAPKEKADHPDHKCST